MLEDMAVTTKLHSEIELLSGKCELPVIRYFQTAAFSVGFDLDAIAHERSSHFKRFNTKSQRMQQIEKNKHNAKKKIVSGLRARHFKTSASMDF